MPTRPGPIDLPNPFAKERSKSSPVPELEIAIPAPLPVSVSEGFFSGFLEDVCLSDFLQVLQLGMRSAEITLWAGARPGILLLDQGKLIHAAAGDLQGDAAFLEICGWPSGEIHVQPLRETPESSVESSLSFLLLELARRTDAEAQRRHEEQTPETDLPSDAAASKDARHLEEQVSELCEQLVRKDSDAVASAVFASGSPLVIGGRFSSRFSRDHCTTFARSIINLYHLMDIRPGSRPHHPLSTTPPSEWPLDEVEISSPDFHHFIRVLDPRPVLACLITRRTGNLGMGRALLNSSVPKLRSLVSALKSNP